MVLETPKEHTMTTPEPTWNVHEHRNELRVSDNRTIYHPEKGQLCYQERHYDCILYYPVKFKDKQSAYKWIESGCIADIQESLQTLSVGFSLYNYKIRNPETSHEHLRSD